MAVLLLNKIYLLKGLARYAGRTHQSQASTNNGISVTVRSILRIFRSQSPGFINIRLDVDGEIYHLFLT